MGTLSIFRRRAVLAGAAASVIIVALSHVLPAVVSLAGVREATGIYFGEPYGLLRALGGAIGGLIAGVLGDDGWGAGATNGLAAGALGLFVLGALVFVYSIVTAVMAGAPPPVLSASFAAAFAVVLLALPHVFGAFVGGVLGSAMRVVVGEVRGDAPHRRSE